MANWLRKKRIFFQTGSLFLNDPNFEEVEKINDLESKKRPLRSDVINFILSKYSEKTNYLEIGVRNPDHNFNLIHASNKFGIDPGIEFKKNPVEFQMTSDEFFNKLRTKEILSSIASFHVIFIDGLHTADQTNKDIENSLDFLSEDGFIVLHDCNPPTEWHARENHGFILSPAKNNWNGTSWKAFFKQRFNKSISCACIDSDWGIGIITKKKIFSQLEDNFNPFFEFDVFTKNRSISLNLMGFENFKSYFENTPD